MPIVSRISQALAGTAAASLLIGSQAFGASEWGPVLREESVREVPYDRELFSPDPEYNITYDPQAEIDIYGGKTAISTPRPPVEIFRDMYDEGPLGDGFTLFGDKNRIFPQILVFGDIRTAVAFNDNGDKELSQIAARANINIDFKLTATERIHVFFQPLQNGGQFTRFEFGGGDKDPNRPATFETQEQPTTAFLEGDLGAIVAGITDEYNKYDIPFAVGKVPLFLQNGVWFDDAFLGGAITPLVAQNSATLDITNYDVTLFAGFDLVSSDAFVDQNGKRADHEANIYGLHGFFDTREGYLEAGYAYLDDGDGSDGDFSYHNFTVAFTKRYAATISNSTRVILNIGQDPGLGLDETANGVLFLSENAFITHLPLTLIPYSNFWFGVDKTQSAARDPAQGGVLKNIGINFETDGLTGFPTLDATGVDTFGGALGVEYLFGFDQQLVAEFAAVFPYDDREGPAKDPQFGWGLRYQKPLTNRLIFRADAMYGMLLEQQDIMGIRAELRLKL
ncbi:MAG: hypothetical protein AAGA26_02845 [Pseudomonadota bacterium]